MAVRVLAGFLICLVIAGLGLAVGLHSLQIVERVNAKLPKTERFAAIGWWTPGKRARLYTEYDRLYPGNHRRRYMAIFYVLTLAAALLLVGILNL